MPGKAAKHPFLLLPKLCAWGFTEYIRREAELSASRVSEPNQCVRKRQRSCG